MNTTNRWLILITISLTIGCIDKQKKQPQTSTIIKEINIVNNVKSFYKEHSNWYQNSVIIEKTNKEFEINLNKFFKSDTLILSDVKFKVKGVREFQKDKYSILLTNDEIVLGRLKRINLEVVGIINEKQMKSIDENKTYYVICNYKKLLNGNELDKYFPNGMFNSNIGINIGLVGDTVFYCGTSLFEINSIK